MTFPANLTNAVDGITEVVADQLNNLEAKVGIDGSLVATSLDYLLKNPASIDPGHQHTVLSGSVTLSKMANLAANSILGNNTASPATPSALSASQVKSLLAIAQADVTGLTTASSPTFTGITVGQVYYDSGNSQLRMGDTSNLGLFLNGQGQFHLRSQVASATLRIVTIGSPRNSFLAFDRANGTFASPTGLLANDLIGDIIGVGYDGVSATMSHGPELQMYALENWDATHNGCGWKFYGVPKGTTTQKLALTIDPTLAGYGNLQSLITSSGTRTTGLLLFNNATTANTAISIDFNPGGNIIAPLARINAVRVTAAVGDTDIVFSNYDGSNLVEKMRIVGLTGSVGIGAANPNTAALLHLASTTKGFLPPVMTTAQKAAISTPPAGLMIYDSNLNKLCVYTGAAWQTITSS